MKSGARAPGKWFEKKGDHRKNAEKGAWTPTDVASWNLSSKKPGKITKKKGEGALDQET